VESRRVYKTPGTPRFKIVCPENDDDIIEPNLQSRYHSGVKMSLYLIKYSQPDLCNVVRELSKCMDKETIGTYLEMLRDVKFVIDMNTFCLKICPENKIKIGVSTYFAKVIGRAIPRKESSLLASLFI
jgi:hypothetical protein